MENQHQKTCENCAHLSCRLYMEKSGDWEEMLPYCLVKRIWEPYKACDEHKEKVE